MLDRGQSPYFQKHFPDLGKRQRITRAVIQINDGIADMAKARGPYVIDQYGLSVNNPLLSQVDAQGRLHLAGESINLLLDDDEPHHSILADHDHIGTVASGLAANYMFVKALNSFGRDVAPFTDREILQHAGILPSQ